MAEAAPADVACRQAGRGRQRAPVVRRRNTDGVVMAKLNAVRDINGQTFVLAEKLDDYRTAALAQAEYWGAGVCCRREIVDSDHRRSAYYALWVGPVRRRRVRLLPDETIKRRKNMVITFFRR